MLTAEKIVGKLSTEEEDVSTTTTPPWSDLLVNSSVPAAAVAVKLCEDVVPDDDHLHVPVKEKRGSVIGSFQRRALSRISFRGENGPLLGRYG